MNDPEIMQELPDRNRLKIGFLEGGNQKETMKKEAIPRQHISVSTFRRFVFFLNSA